MDDTEIERRIRQAGYDIAWEQASEGDTARVVFALRDGKRHTRNFPTLLALGEHVGRVDKPVRFIEDSEAIDAAIAKHSQLAGHFAVRRASCRVALFNRLKYVQLVSMAGDATAMYELRPDALRKTSNGNLPPEIVKAFHRGHALEQSSLFSAHL
jgi:hypothetical protein